MLPTVRRRAPVANRLLAALPEKEYQRLEKAVQEELARLLRDGITQDELDQARKGYLQSQKVSRSSDTALAGILSGLRHAGRTMAYEAAMEKKINALTPENVQTALQKHIDPKKLVVVSAGDFETKAADKVAVP